MKSLGGIHQESPDGALGPPRAIPFAKASSGSRAGGPACWILLGTGFVSYIGKALKEPEYSPLEWTKQCTQVFKSLKVHLASAPVLGASKPTEALSIIRS